MVTKYLKQEEKKLLQVRVSTELLENIRTLLKEYRVSWTEFTTDSFEYFLESLNQHDQTKKKSKVKKVKGK